MHQMQKNKNFIVKFTLFVIVYIAFCWENGFCCGFARGGSGGGSGGEPVGFHRVGRLLSLSLAASAVPEGPQPPAVSLP